MGAMNKMILQKIGIQEAKKGVFIDGSSTAPMGVEEKSSLISG